MTNVRYTPNELFIPLEPAEHAFVKRMVIATRVAQSIFLSAFIGAQIYIYVFMRDEFGLSSILTTGILLSIAYVVTCWRLLKIPSDFKKNVKCEVQTTLLDVKKKSLIGPFFGFLYYVCIPDSSLTRGIRTLKIGQRAYKKLKTGKGSEIRISFLPKSGFVILIATKDIHLDAKEVLER